MNAEIISKLGKKVGKWIKIINLPHSCRDRTAFCPWISDGLLLAGGVHLSMSIFPSHSWNRGLCFGQKAVLSLHFSPPPHTKKKLPNRAAYEILISSRQLF